MFSRDGTFPRKLVICLTSRICMGYPTRTRATALAANLPAYAPTVNLLTPDPTPQGTLIQQPPTHTPTPRQGKLYLTLKHP